MPDQTLPFWWLIGLLLLVLIVGHLIIGLIWWATRKTVLAIRENSTQATHCLNGHRPLLTTTNAHFPQISTWVTTRCATDRFSGLPLTLCVILGAVIASLGSYLTKCVIEHSQIVRLDHYINVALAPLRNPDLLHLFATLTYLAEVSTLAIITLVAIAFLWFTRRRIYIPGLLLTVLGAEMMTGIGKYVIDRARPDFLTFASSTSPSFPSNHATGALAVYGIIAYIVARNLNNTVLRFELVYWVGALIALIAASRLLLSVHYTSDITAGLLVGGFWLLAGCALTEYLHERAVLCGAELRRSVS